MDISGHRSYKCIDTHEEYFSSFTHELFHKLQTPLTHIEGFAELILMDRDLSPAHADYVRAILSGSETLKMAVISYLHRVEETQGE